VSRPGWSAGELALKRAFDRVERRIEERYGLPVVISDVLDPNTGDFDGVTIKLDHSNELEVALFVLAHLFGHTAQWATDARLRELGTRYGVERPPPELLGEIQRYERDASRIALTLFHEAGVTELDQWLADWAAADWGFLEHFYRTGERVDFRRFLGAGAPPLEPLPIPSFRPERWVSRFSF
jgi:hypothetical protein